MNIRSDRKKGMTYTEIAKKYYIDPRTAKKYAESDTKPIYNLTDPKPSILDEYTAQVDIWLEEALYSAVRIHENLKELEFQGG